MAHTGLRFVIEPSHHPIFDALRDAVAKWPAHKADQFEADWRAMEKEGAQIADVTCEADRIIGSVGQDFIQHCAAWGISPKPEK